MQKNAEKYFARCLLALTLTAPGMANGNLSIDAYLGKATIGNLFISDDQNIAPDDIPSWLNSIEVRASADDSDDRKQSLSLRLQPKGFGQSKLERTILHLQDKHQNLESARDLGARLKFRYLTIIDLFLQSSKLQLLKDKVVLTGKEIQFFKSLSVTDDFKPGQLLLTEIRQHELQQVLKINQVSLQQQLNFLDLKLTHNEDILIPAEIARIIHTEKPDVSKNIDFAQKNLKLKLANENLTLEETKQGSGFSLIQFKFDHQDKSKNDHSVTLGWNFPFGKSSFGIAEKQREITDTTIRLHRIKNQLVDSQKSTQQSLTKQNALAEVITNSLEKIGQRFSQATQSNDAEMVLILEKERLRLLEKLNEIHQRARILYINYLDISGKLTEKPLRNWLRNGQPML